MLATLLELSRDFLIVAEPDGRLLDVGAHLRQALGRRGVTTEALEVHLRQALPLTQGLAVLPLEQYGLHASAFSRLSQEANQLVLIAQDLSLQHVLEGLRSEVLLAMQNLKREEHLHHTLLDESSDPIFGFKEDGTYLYVNNIFARTLGYEKEEIIGKKIWDIFSLEEADKRFAAVQKVFQTGETDNIEVRVPLPAGGDKYFLTTIKPVKDGDGQVLFVICISKDITELRETQGQLQTLHGLLPICSACKNIRNDKGAWQQVEDYISLHSAAVFTHGICPDCARKLYPGMFE